MLYSELGGTCSSPISHLEAPKNATGRGKKATYHTTGKEINFFCELPVPDEIFRQVGQRSLQNPGLHCSIS